MRKTRLPKHVLPPTPADVAAALNRGPMDERRDATRTVLPTASEIMRLQGAQQEFDELRRMSKADVPRPRPGAAMALVDIGDTGGQRVQFARPVGLSFDQLRQVKKNSEILKLIHATRIRQFQAFLNIPEGKGDPGFRLRFKNRKRQVTDADQERFDWLTNYLLNCGAEFDPRVRRAQQRDDLDGFFAKHLGDSLTLDHAPIELIPTAGGRVHGFVAPDAAHIYLTDPNAGLLGEFEGPADFNQLLHRVDMGSPQNIIAVYEKDGRALAQYTHMDMMVQIRNMTSEEAYYGYGMPEPEELVRIMTNIANAMNVNARSITDNAQPRGIFTLNGEYRQEDIEAFQYRMRAEFTGASNRHRLMVLRGEEGTSSTFTPTGPQVEDQLYARWMTLNIVVSCALYSMSPAEISFDSFSPGNTALSGSDTEAQLTSGQDKGLSTLLKWGRKTLNELIQMQDPDVELAWNGLSVSKEDVEQEENDTLTWGEKRTAKGESNEGIDEKLLNTPLNPSVAGVYGQIVQAAMQPQQPQPGQEGAGLPGQDGRPDGGEGEDPQQTEQEEADLNQEEGPQGERRFQDHENQVWQVPHGQTLQKAASAPYQPRLWPD